jgi:hypothetical protein
VLSFAGGIIHTYYTVELAPAVAALVAIGSVLLWRARSWPAARFALAAGAGLTGTWSSALLRRAPSFHPWVGWVVLVAGFVTAGLLLVPALRRGLVVVALVGGLVTLTGGSAAYALDTAATAHTGSTPSAGPAVAGSGGFGGPRGGKRPAGGFPGGGTSGGSTSGGAPSGGAPSGSVPGGGSGSAPSGGSGSAPSGGAPSGGAPSGSTPTRGAGGGDMATSSALQKLIKATTTTWAAATVGSQQASSLELSTGKAVIAIGGFSGSDDAPTLAQFEKWVAEGRIGYFIAGGGMGGGRTGGADGGAAGRISQWVSQHYTATTVGGSTVYDLTKASS